MDKLDNKIIKILERNGRATNTEIAGKIKVSEGTVRKRISSLLKKEIIKRFTIDLRTKSGFIALVLINTEPNAYLQKIIKKIKLLEGIKKISELAGGFDLVVEIQIESAEKFNSVIDSIRTIPKIKNTESLIVLKTTF